LGRVVKKDRVAQPRAIDIVLANGAGGLDQAIYGADVRAFRRERCSTWLSLQENDLLFFHAKE